MKRILKLLFIFVLGFLFVPVVHAKDMPKEGVAYYLMYPDGTTDVAEKYTDAVNPEEKFLFTAVTDENGNVPFCDCIGEGKLRIVQHVPAGYTTNEREVTIDLATTNSANFVDYRGGNPKTGRSFLILFGVAGVVITTIAVSRKNKKSLLVIPAFIAVATIYHVSALPGGCFNIKVSDGQGNPLAGVTVDVYGTPVVYDYGPSVKFDANGGTFFDGKTTMYFKLPSAQATVDEFLAGLTDEERNYFNENSNRAYRDGYYPDGYDYPDVLVNGTVVKLYWDNDDVKYIKLDGNGGTYDFYGEALTDLTLDSYTNVYDFMDNFSRDDYYAIGIDDNAACTAYTSGGTPREYHEVKRQIDYQDIYYMCWNPKPDGIYVNGELFIGNPDTCYRDSSFNSYNSNSFKLYNRKHYLNVYRINDPEDIHFYFEEASHDVLARDFSEDVSSTLHIPSEPISTIEFVQNGVVVVSLTANDLSGDGSYYVTNMNKANTLVNYLETLYDNDCIGGHDYMLQ